MTLDLFDLICIGIGCVGTGLSIYLFKLNGWDIEKTMFKEEE